MKVTLLLFLMGLLCHTGFAQSNDSLVVLFNSRPGLRLALGDNANLWRQNNRQDANGDGQNDLLLVREDATGSPEALMVYFNLGVLLDSATVSWSTLVGALGGREPTRFLGFYPFFDTGTGLKDAVFRSADGIVIVALSQETGKQAGRPGAMRSLPASQAAIIDLDDDGRPELLIRNRETDTVQVWGRPATTTATEEEIEAALSRLFQNYPNPFRDQTTIAYAVDHPGAVTLAVYDLLGRRVRTLVDRDHPTGTYRVAWDGRDGSGQPVASGTYFYRLHVGDAVSSKQAIRLR